MYIGTNMTCLHSYKNSYQLLFFLFFSYSLCSVLFCIHFRCAAKWLETHIICRGAPGPGFKPPAGPLHPPHSYRNTACDPRCTPRPRAHSLTTNLSFSGPSPFSPSPPTSSPLTTPVCSLYLCVCFYFISFFRFHMQVRSCLTHYFCCQL